MDDALRDTRSKCFFNGLFVLILVLMENAL